MARLALEEGMNLDVATGGEYHVALAAGAPATAGAPRQQQVAWTSCDAPARWARPSSSTPSTSSTASRRCTPRTATRPRVLVRVTPGVEAHTHEFVRTGQDDSKFGFGVASGDAAKAVERAGASAGRRARRRARAHRQPGLRGRLLRAGGRGRRAVPRRTRPAGAVDRRRPRRGLRRGRGGADDHAVGAIGPRRGADGGHHAHASPPSRVGRSSPRRRSRSTRSAPSRTCPASAPTCRSTAA